MTAPSARRGPRIGALLVAAFLGASLASCGGPSERPVRVSSKAFTEGVILGEVLHLLVESEGIPCEHLAAVGGTRIVFDALVAGELDAYVEYTGTLQRDILAKGGRRSLAQLRDELEAMGVRMGPTLGFNNTYDLGMRRARADELGITSISDLRDHPDLVFGLSHEFAERPDGWPGLQRRYGLKHKVVGLDHDIAYRAVASGDVDVIDLYSTDAKIQLHDLVTLEDDQTFFPSYEALVLYRIELEETRPEVVQAFETLRDRIDETTMAGLNAGVDVEKREESAVAAEFLESELSIYVTPGSGSVRLERFLRGTREHLGLVLVSLVAAILIGVSIGIVAAKTGAFGQAMIGMVGAVQTFPGLALLALMVPVFGIGWLPTVIALIVYSLLPIVRNTHAGLTGIPRELRESAEVLGLSGRTRLFTVELPLAAPSILAGIKTAAVWNVGLATLGALIGGGGYGYTILSGLRRADNGLILEGAIPAIALALLMQALFDLLERRVVSRGLRTTA